MNHMVKIIKTAKPAMIHTFINLVSALADSSRLNNQQFHNRDNPQSTTNNQQNSCDIIAITLSVEVEARLSYRMDAALLSSAQSSRLLSPASADIESTARQPVEIV